MTYITTLECFSHTFDFDVLVDVIDDLSQLKFYGESRKSLLIHIVSLLGFYDRNEVPSDDIAFGLFTFILEGNVKQSCHTFPTTSIHYFEHMIR